MIKRILFSLLCVFAFTAKAQQVTLFAGSQYVGDGGYSGATGAINKLSDSFSIPWGIAVDTAGRFWITDQHNVSIIIGNNNYVKGGYTGNPTDPGAGDYADKTGTVSRFANPSGCAVHRTTNIVYVCDADNNLIRSGSQVRNNTDQVIWGTVCGKRSFLGGYADGVGANAEFAAPQDIAIASNGTMYVADRDNHCIRKIVGTTVSTIAGLGETSGDADGNGSTARFTAPTGLFLVDDNTLLVADRNNGKIRSINLTTKDVTTVVTGLNLPSDIVKVDGTIYIADANCIRAWDGTKLVLYAGKLNTSGYVNSTTDPLAARFGSITTIDHDPKTLSLYVTDMGNNVFRRVTIVAPAVADFTADKTSVSANQVVTFTSSSSNANTLAWNITPGTYTLVNGSTLSSNKIYVTFQNVGSYTVELTATNGSGSNKKTRTNYINVSLIGSNKPAPDFYADKTSATVSDVVSFIDQTGDNPQSFAWTFTPNTVTFQNGTTASDRFPKVKFDAAGKYTVQLVATNTNGSNTKVKTDYVTVTTAGIENVAPANITLYPNPAANILHIDGEYHLIQIVATNGKITTVTADNGQVNISDLTDGIYSIYAINKEGKVVTGRFIKLGN